MSQLAIQNALVGAYIDDGPRIDTAYEGMQFKPGNAAWGSVYMLPAGAGPVTLGVGGEDEHIGVMQIDINVPQGFGTAQLLELSQQVLDVFISGRRFSCDDQSVLIASASRNPIRNIDGWLRGGVSVNWSARTTRPEV